MVNLADETMAAEYTTEDNFASKTNLIDLGERFQGVRETALAVCHHFSQPLTVIMCLLDLLMMKKADEKDIEEILFTMKRQAEVMQELLAKLREVECYETKEYSGFKMLNLEKNSL